MDVNDHHKLLRFSLKECSAPKVLLTLFFVLLCLNLFVINIWILKQMRESKYISVLGTKTTTKTTTSSTCPNACVVLINKSSSKSTVTTGSSAKEFFVSIGSGTLSATDWTDVAGAQATIDTKLYGRIKQTLFEATVQNPYTSQKIWVRLYNITDSHPVWYSEVNYEGMTGTLLTSNPIVLDSGAKTYKVQMKTQLAATASLTQSRIRITTY